MILQGHTYVLLGLEGFTYWSSQNLTPKDQDKVRQWLKHQLELIKEQNDYALFKIRSNPSIK
jgi:hypothetical protein